MMTEPTEREREMIVVLHGMAIQLRKMMWLGGELSRAQQWWKAQMMLEPSAGDLVFETSTASRCTGQNEQDFVRIGWFVKTDHEPRLEWNVSDYGPNPGERVTYVRPLGGGEPVRWTNCEFQRLPANVDDAYYWFRDPAEISASEL